MHINVLLCPLAPTMNINMYINPSLPPPTNPPYECKYAYKPTVNVAIGTSAVTQTLMCNKLFRLIRGGLDKKGSQQFAGEYLNQTGAKI